MIFDTRFFAIQRLFPLGDERNDELLRNRVSTYLERETALKVRSTKPLRKGVIPIVKRGREAI